MVFTVKKLRMINPTEDGLNILDDSEYDMTFEAEGVLVTKAGTSRVVPYTAALVPHSAIADIRIRITG